MRSVLGIFGYRAQLARVHSYKLMFLRFDQCQYGAAKGVL